MTRKRYIGLARALMLKINDGTNPEWKRGKMLKHIEGIRKEDVKYDSYQEAWDSLIKTRKMYGMD